MEQILQAVSGYEMMPFLDGFFGYIQFLVQPNDRLKTTFKTKLGTYAYQKIPFDLVNADTTFQRAMDISLRGLINKYVVVYLDDITIYSRNCSDHISHLKHVFE
jgi:hypothetical protein